MRRKKIIRIWGMILCICMAVGLIPGSFMMVKAEEEVQYVRIKCHNVDVNYYMAVSESDQTKPYAAVTKDYGWDYTVWIEEDTGNKTSSGNRIVKLKNYATKDYIGIADNQLVMMEDGGDAVKWEVEIKNDHEGAWMWDGPMMDWNRYKVLNSNSGQYICTEGLNNQEGNLILSENAADDWWSNEWKYEAVATDELINQPGDAATDEEKGVLSSEIETAKAILNDPESYQTKSLRNLESVVATAEKVLQYANATGTTINVQIEAVNSAVEKMIKAEDSKLYAQGEMAIAGQEQIGDKGEYYLDFAEEFEGSTLNPDVWLDEYLPHWAEDEEASKARYEIRDGKLALQIRKGDQPWSSNDGQVICSGITTFNKNYLHNFSGYNTLYEHKDSSSTDNNYFNGYTTQYGYIEMRAKLEDDGGQGHQALWLVGTQSDTNDWANSKQTAEIDMLETSFYDSYRNWRLCGYGWNDSSFCPWWNTFDSEVPYGDPGKEYHTYGMEWTPEKLNFYYDGEYYRTIDYSPQYAMGIILSIYQNAGWSTGDRESGTAWPKEMLVDYLRVYKPVGGYDKGYVDTKALEQELEKAKGEVIKADVYTVDSIKKLEETIKSAEAAVKNENITKAEILQQIQELQESVKELKSILPYQDVSETDWFYREAAYTYGKEIMTGLTQDIFGPAKPLNRAQAAVALWRMAGKPKADSVNAFPDIEEDSWYADAVNWAAEEGIVTGYMNGLFGPGDVITREQAVTILWRFAKTNDMDVSAKAELDSYQDGTGVQTFAREAMQWAVGNNIVKGKDEGRVLDPQGSITRAEYAVIITRFIKAYME